MSEHAHGPQSFWSKYVFSQDHKVIGIQYLITAMVMGLIGAGLSVWFRVQLAWPGKAGLAPEQYLSFITMHGTIMIFFVVSLALSSGFANFLVPLQVGARDMAYPFLNMLSYWTIVPACLLMLVSFFVSGGAAAGGWTAYPPLSVIAPFGMTLWLLAMALFIVSFTMSSLNVVTTVFNQRARGMTMMKLPLTTWSYLVASVIGLLSFPALTAAAIMLLLDRHLGTSFYMPAGLVVSGKPLDFAGGTPLLFQHLFWFLGHPEVYVLVLPAIGIAFDVIAANTRRPPHGYRISVYALIVIAILGMIVWGHHMFTSGMNPYLGKYFSIATLTITFPFAALGVNLVASLWKSKLRMNTAMLFALGLISAVGTGGLGGLYLGNAAADIHFHDTYFVVGHFHLMIGVVTLFGVFAAVYHWFPKMFGRLMNEKLGTLHFWCTLVPALLIFTLMHFQGLGGMMRRYYENTQVYAQPVQGLNPVISILAMIAFAAQIVFMANFFWSACCGRKASENPWQATTLEWSAPSPPPHGNWPGELPEAPGEPYDYGTEGEADFRPQWAGEPLKVTA